MTATSHMKTDVSDAEMAKKLRHYGLRPTKQRLSLSQLMFAHGHRHMTAEQLYHEAQARDLSLSLATVYNTLHQFAEAGLLREINFERMPCYFDTDTREHVHFFMEDKQEMIDVHVDESVLERLPSPPEGYEVAGASMVIRLRPSSQGEAETPSLR